MTPQKLETLKITASRPASARALLVRFEGGPTPLYEAYRVPGLSIPVKAGAVGPLPAPLCSQPERRYFEVLAPRDDALGEALAKLPVGAEVDVGAPFGTGFPVFDFRRHDLHLIGFGAGMGTIRAAALHALTERGAFENVRVLAEGRFLEEIPFREEFPGWQRAGVRIYQVLARPDMGKWRRGEGAYVADSLRELAPDPKRSVVIVSGPDDMVRGVKGACAALRIPPDRLFIFEQPTPEPERAREAERPKEALARISAEGKHGSGHQCDAPDHAPGFRTPAEQPRPEGLPPYKRPGAGAGRH